MSASKVALVTGAGSGIGRASSLALVEAGWTVVLVGRRREALEDTLRQGAAGAPMRVHAADICDPQAVRDLFDAVQSEHGRLDLLFNNAGAGAPAKPLEELSLESWRR